MRHKKARNAKWIFSFMVPLTIIAFVFAILSIDYSNMIDPSNLKFNVFDGVSLIIILYFIS